MSYPCLIPIEVIADAKRRKIPALEAEICAIRKHILDLNAGSRGFDADGHSICDWKSACKELEVEVAFLTTLITDHVTRKREEARNQRTLV